MYFNNVKDESVFKVFCTAVDNIPVTRSDISEMTGLSVMTVGKIIDALIDGNILTQHTDKADRAGRRSRSVHLRAGHYIAVYVLSTIQFSVYITDLSLKVLDGFSRKVQNDLTLDDELTVFYYDAYRFICANYNINKFIGTGIIIPGAYNESTGFADLSRSSDPAVYQIISNINGKIPGNEIYVTDGKTTVMRYLSQFEDAGTSLLVYFIGDTVRSCYFRAGDETFFKGDCGMLPYFSNEALTSSLSNTIDPEYLAEIISRLMLTVCCTVHTDKLYITGDLYENMGIFCDLIRRKLILKCEYALSSVPEIICGIDVKTAVSGISAEIRDKWFKREILQNH